MSETKGDALARGRERMRRQNIFGPSDAAELLAAGKSPGFDPEHNTVDAKIAQFLCGTHGGDWRKVGQPTVELWRTPEERRAIEALQAAVNEKRPIYERALDRRFEVERLYYNPPPRTTVQQLAQLS